MGRKMKMEKSDKCEEECLVSNMPGTNFCHDNIQTNRHHSKKKKKHRSRHERGEGTLENSSHCVGQADLATQENTNVVDSDKAGHSFSKKRHKSKSYSVADGAEEEVNSDEQYLFAKKKHKSKKEKKITALDTEPKNNTKNVDSEEHAAVQTSASLQSEESKRKHSELKEKKLCDLEEGKLVFNPDENIFLTGSNAKKAPVWSGASNVKSYTGDQDGESVAHCKTKRSGKDASSELMHAGKHERASALHKRVKKITLESTKETQAVESSAQSCGGDIQVQFESSFATILDIATELQTSKDGDKKKKKKHKSKKRPLSAESEMDKSELETCRSDYRTEYNCSKINSYELATELNRSKEHRLAENIKSHKSKKKVRPAESNMHSSADIPDMGNSVDWTGSKRLNTHEDSAVLKKSDEKSPCKKKKMHKLQENTRTTECATNDSANFGEANKSSSRTFDLSDAFEALKKEALKEVTTHENHTREKFKKKKKKSRKETRTKEFETSSDLVYHTGAIISQTAITKDHSHSIKHKLKSDCDLETANVGISQKPKNGELQGRRTTDSKIQDSINIGEGDKSRVLPEGDLSDILEAATKLEVNVFENHIRENIKKSCLSRKKTRSEDFFELICLKDSIGETQDSAVIGEVDKAQSQQTEADLSNALEAIAEEVTVLKNCTEGKNKNSHKSKKGTKAATFETNGMLLSSTNGVLLSSEMCSTNYSQTNTTKSSTGVEKKHKSKSECDMKSANITNSQYPNNCEPEDVVRSMQCAENATVEVDKSRDQADRDPFKTLEVAKEASADINHVREKRKKHKSIKQARTAYCETSLDALSSNDCTTEPQTGITEDHKGSKKKRKKSKSESDIQYANMSTTGHGAESDIHYANMSTTGHGAESDIQYANISTTGHGAESAHSGAVNLSHEDNLNYTGGEDSVKKRAGQKHKTANKGLNDLQSVPCVTSLLRTDDEMNHANASEHRLIMQNIADLQEESESANEEETVLGGDYCGSLVCYLCSVEQTSGSAYIQHLAGQHDLSVYRCQRCKANLATLRQWKRHTKLTCRGTVVKVAPFKCSLCPQSFSRNDGFKTHLKNAHQGEPESYPCGYCSRSFTRPDYAKNHSYKCKFGLAKTRGEKTKKCPVCGKMFTNNSNMYVHKQTMHSNRQMLFFCSCGIHFLHKKYFYKHLQKVGWKSMVKNAASFIENQCTKK